MVHLLCRATNMTRRAGFHALHTQRIGKGGRLRCTRSAMQVPGAMKMMKPDKNCKNAERMQHARRDADIPRPKCRALPRMVLQLLSQGHLDVVYSALEDVFNPPPRRLDDAGGCGLVVGICWVRKTFRYWFSAAGNPT